MSATAIGSMYIGTGLIQLKLLGRSGTLLKLSKMGCDGTNVSSLLLIKRHSDTHTTTRTRASLLLINKY